MTKLTVDNSYSRIEGLEPKAEKNLRDELSYVIGGQSAYFSGYGAKRRSLLSKRGEFASGLLTRVEMFLKKNNIKYNVVDLRIIP